MFEQMIYNKESIELFSESIIIEKLIKILGEANDNIYIY